MKKWQTEKVAINDVATWADNAVTKEWGKKAAARVYHICDSGKDIDIDDPFEAGTATKKPIRYLGRVRGCPERAETCRRRCRSSRRTGTTPKNGSHGKLQFRFCWTTLLP
jgi:hypothetical protein